LTWSGRGLTLSILMVNIGIVGAKMKPGMKSCPYLGKCAVRLASVLEIEIT
jgi:hypothetical protein